MEMKQGIYLSVNEERTNNMCLSCVPYTKSSTLEPGDKDQQSQETSREECKEVTK
jgi:hypothetical protein